jgi:hypothetical protein
VATLAFSRALIDLTTAAGVHDFALAVILFLPSIRAYCQRIPNITYFEN